MYYKIDNACHCTHGQEGVAVKIFLSTCEISRPALLCQHSCKVLCLQCSSQLPLAPQQVMTTLSPCREDDYLQVCCCVLATLPIGQANISHIQNRCHPHDSTKKAKVRFQPVIEELTGLSIFTDDVAQRLKDE